jgi:hypothetical protein
MPTLIVALIPVIEAAITEAPQLYTELKTLFSSNTPPTAAQWAALLAKVSSEDFVG